MIAIAFFVTESCKTTAINNQTSEKKNKSEPIPNWVGIFTGVTPCADCEGIYTILQLNADETYTLQTRYLGKAGKTEKTTGTFIWNKSKQSNTIQLNSDENSIPKRFLIGTNSITQLDMEGNIIEGNLANAYLLLRADTRIFDKNWTLVELNGRIVQEDSLLNKRPYFTTKLDGSIVNGFGGCNMFFGMLELTKNNRIHFPPMASTQMACPNLELESAFINTIQKADNFYIKGDTLILNKAKMATLARFVSVP
jgi:heat shock protein HslJ